MKGNRAFGPGVIDMKASLVSLYYALTAMKQAGKKGYQNVQIILNSDEELGSPSSREIIRRHAANKKYALILEALARMVRLLQREEGAVNSKF